MVSAIGAGAWPRVASAQWCGNCATEWTQIANNIQLGMSYAEQLKQSITQELQFIEQIRQTITQIEMLKTDIQNIQSAVKGAFSNPLQAIAGIGKVMDVGQSISGSFADVQSKLADTFGPAIAIGGQLKTFTQQLKGWSDSAKDTLTGALKSVGMTRDGFKSESDALMALFEKSASTKGNLEALQSVAEIGVANVSQLQQLRSMVATQTAAQSTYYLAQQKEADQKKEGQKMMAPSKTDYNDTARLKRLSDDPWSAK
jgi:P-type conjugative transfer protein TrbJ